MAAMARRLARVWLRQLDQELGRGPRDEEKPLVVVAPRDEVGASTGGFVHPARLDGEARPQVVEHAAHVDLVEVAAKVLVLHPEGAVVGLGREGEHLAQPVGPGGRVVGPLAVPFGRLAVGLEWDAQLHQPVVLKLAARHHRIRAVEQDALLARLRPVLPLGVVGTADHVRCLQLLEHLDPQPVGVVALGRDPLLLALGQVELVADAPGKVLEALRHRAALHRLVGRRELGIGLLDDGRPVGAARGVPGEGGLAVVAARQPIVDEDDLPVVVRVWVVAVELAHVEALLLPLGVQLSKEDTVELLAVAGDNVERRDQPAVVVAVGHLPAADDPLRGRPVVLEHGHVVGRHIGPDLLWAQPLRHLRHADLRHPRVLAVAVAVLVHSRLVRALRGAGRAREASVARVLKLAAVRRAVVERLLDEGILPFLDVLGERRALARHDRHVLGRLRQAERLLDLEALCVPERAVVALVGGLRAQL
mmetsp:Transcript_30759/g.80195  ORF Transcript_30759/g.80195 Transcript_30759/m.80195 type:complete len:477 (-) Transcript_30759:100-1530(-)